jgi:hypothetical protein
MTTCECGMWPIEEYGRKCPSCDLEAPEQVWVVQGVNDILGYVKDAEGVEAKLQELSQNEDMEYELVRLEDIDSFVASFTREDS